MRKAGNMAWTGNAESVTIWGERYAAIGDLAPGDEFKLYDWKWRVRRHAGRTTFADGITYGMEWCRIQLKHSRRVEVPYVVVAESNREGPSE